MSAFSAPTDRRSRFADPARLIAPVRAALALAWAVALFVVVHGETTQSGADLMLGVAALLASYPLIDVAASILTARSDRAARPVMSVNALISAAAIAAIAIAGFGSDASATLVSFGAWASVSGLIQLGVAIHRRRATGGQLPMIIGGGLSTLAGVMFAASASGHTAHLTNIAGYMALGAVLFLVWAFRDRARTR